jgi:hypothetical protein
MNIPSPKRVLEAWSALVGIWGSSYLALLDELDIELGLMSEQVSESLQWPLLIIGAAGTGSVLFSSWKDAKARRRPEPPRLLPRR